LADGYVVSVRDVVNSLDLLALVELRRGLFRNDATIVSPTEVLHYASGSRRVVALSFIQPVKKPAFSGRMT
jgi:hypothetical protein